MDYYLGQPIEVLETEQGWLSIWHHRLVGQIEIGFFLTGDDALELTRDLIRRDFAAISLMKVVDEWYEMDLVTDHEHDLIQNSLVQSVLAVLNQ
jgi:hypothetical protein